VSLLRHTTSNNDCNDFLMDDTWTPLLSNLGHVRRKLKKYDQAIEFHQKTLLVSPMWASTFAALGYVYSLTIKYDQAIDYFQKALALKRDDTFSTTMLDYVLDAYLNEAPVFSV
jgi:anaphase-promoting complex subunit 6